MTQREQAWQRLAAAEVCVICAGRLTGRAHHEYGRAFCVKCVESQTGAKVWVNGILEEWFADPCKAPAPVPLVTAERGGLDTGVRGSVPVEECTDVATLLSNDKAIDAHRGRYAKAREAGIV